MQMFVSVAFKASCGRIPAMLQFFIPVDIIEVLNSARQTIYPVQPFYVLSVVGSGLSALLHTSSSCTQIHWPPGTLSLHTIPPLLSVFLCVCVCVYARWFLFIPLSMRTYSPLCLFVFICFFPSINYRDGRTKLSNLKGYDPTASWSLNAVTYTSIQLLHTHNNRAYKYLKNKTKGGFVSLIVHISLHKMRGRKSEGVITRFRLGVSSLLRTVQLCIQG